MCQERGSQCQPQFGPEQSCCFGLHCNHGKCVENAGCGREGWDCGGLYARSCCPGFHCVGGRTCLSPPDP